MNGLVSFAVRILSMLRNPLVINEHFIPKYGLNLEPYLKHDKKVSRTSIHHLARYYWAIERLSSRAKDIRILDIACGAGYGSFLIAQAFPRAVIVGVDYDHSAINYALKTYQLANLQFVYGDILNWDRSIGTSKFDFIISFDTLEHLDHREIVLENLVNHLISEGELLLSTPCGNEHTNLHPRWPYHKIEYSADSLYTFLRRYFNLILQPMDPFFPHSDIFEKIKEYGIEYDHHMNPVICQKPIIINVQGFN